MARTDPVEVTKHGLTRIDPYHWIADREDPEVLAYVEAENTYAEAMMTSTRDLQRRLMEEITERVQETDLSVPDPRGDYLYYTKWEEGQEYPIYARRGGSQDAREEILLDVNALAAGGEPIAVRPPIVSPAHDILAFHVHFTDQPPSQNLFRFRDLNSGEILADEIPGPTLGWSAEWGNDNRTFFYIKLPPETGPWQVFRHVLGTDPAEDQLVHEETGRDTRCRIFKTRSGRYLVIRSYSSGFATYAGDHFLDLIPAPVKRLKRFMPPGVDNTSAIEEELGGFFYFLSGHPTGDSRIVRTPVDRRDPAFWEEVTSEGDDASIEQFWLYRNHLVVEEKTRRTCALPVPSR